MLTNYSLKAWGILIFLAVVWGSSFILMEKALHDEVGNNILSPEAVASLRITLASLVLLPIALSRLRLITKKNVLPLLAVGTLGNLVPAFLFTAAQASIESSYAGMLNSLTPFFVITLGISLFGLRVRWVNLAGLIIGLAGAVTLFIAKGTGLGDNVFKGSVLVVIATLGYGTSVNLIRYYLQDLSALLITAFTFSLLFLPSLIYLLCTDFTHTMQTHPQAWGAISYTAVLAVIGTALAILLFNYLIKISNAVFATSVTYLIPVVAIAWGVVNSETFSWPQLAAIPIILIGVYFVNRPLEQRPKPTKN